MRNGLTLVLSHFFAASRTSLSDLFIQLWACLTAQAAMGKLYLSFSVLRALFRTQFSVKNRDYDSGIIKKTLLMFVNILIDNIFHFQNLNLNFFLRS
jgi:hypothetical protein